MAQLQVMLGVMQMDMVQGVARAVRDENGMVRPPFIGDADTAMLEFTRAGRANPLAQPRSNLQRVAYGMKEGGLERLSWQVLDRAQDSAPQQTLRLPGVVDWELRFLDRDRQWHSDWAAITSGRMQAPPSPLPLAVEVVIELEDWGRIRRLFRLPEAAL
jgi:general secretion pathway protein J